MKWLYFFFLLLISDTCFLKSGKADPWKNLSKGDQAAEALLNQIKQKKTDAGAHPFYKGIPKEANISSDNLKGQAQRAANQNPAAQMIFESSDARPQVKIDPLTDPLFIGSKEVMNNPLEVIGGKGTQVMEVQQGGKTETINCEESGEDSLETCTRELVVRVIKIKVLKEKAGSIHLTGCKKSHKDWHARSCPTLLSQMLQWRRPKFWKKNGGAIDVTKDFKDCLQEVVSKHSTRCYRCNNPRTTLATDLTADVINSVVIERNHWGQPLIHGSTNSSRHGRLKTYDLSATIKIVYEADSYQILPDEWSDNCARLEERVNSGLCGYYSRICTQGRQTRIINSIPITRDCWQYTMTYYCSYPAKDDCGALRARGCAQIHSTCKQMVGNACVIYQQTYQCKDAPRTTFQIVGGNTPFCMDGNCRDQSWDPNDEMMSSVAQLSILKEMQGNFANGFLFKGVSCPPLSRTLSSHF